MASINRILLGGTWQFVLHLTKYLAVFFNGNPYYVVLFVCFNLATVFEKNKGPLSS